MEKNLIKIIKRKDAEAAANAKLQSEPNSKSAEASSAEVVERRLRRRITEVISNWIPHRAENNRVAEIAAVRRFFGSESLLTGV